MPIYDYKCQNCSHLFEAMVPISDRDKYQQCPNCKAEFGKHLITPVNFHLPGHRMDWPTAADKWTREHERAARKGKEKEAELENDLNSKMY